MIRHRCPALCVLALVAFLTSDAPAAVRGDGSTVGCPDPGTTPASEECLRKELGIPPDARRVVIISQSSHLDWDWRHTFENYFAGPLVDPFLFLLPGPVDTILSDAVGLMTRFHGSGVPYYYSVAEMGYLARFVQAHPELLEPPACRGKRPAHRGRGRHVARQPPPARRVLHPGLPRREELGGRDARPPHPGGVAAGRLRPGFPVADRARGDGTRQRRVRSGARGRFRCAISRLPTARPGIHRGDVAPRWTRLPLARGGRLGGPGALDARGLLPGRFRPRAGAGSPVDSRAGKACRHRRGSRADAVPLHPDRLRLRPPETRPARRGGGLERGRVRPDRRVGGRGDL